MDDKTTQNLLDQESAAFDKQILERIANGHLPDLRRATECTWFYNNPWRHPDYVELDFGEQCQRILKVISSHCQTASKPVELLEVGCGPGYMSLELARNGVNVTGVDISPACIEVAKKTAAEDPWEDTRGKLNYLCGNFHDPSLIEDHSFDVVLFLGALHHFPDQKSVMQRVSQLLKQRGFIVVHEPTRDRMTRGNAAIIHLVRLLLSQGNGFHENVQIPSSAKELGQQIDAIYNSMRYEDDDGEKLQSVNDNEAGYRDMLDALEERFEQILLTDRYAFFHETIGGLRFEQNKNRQLAKYLREIDGELCRTRLLQATEFLYAGRLKE